jgi:hypothetical protein
MLSYIEYGGKNSLRDFGAFILRSSVRNPPQKKVLLANIPYNNYPLQFDMSEIYGEAFYEPRILEYTFRLISFAHDSVELYNRYQMMCNWLYQSHERKLEDSEYPSTYFNAICTGITGMEKGTNNSGDFTVTFTADPYRRTDDYADVPWDMLIFDHDCLNQNEICVEPKEGQAGVDVKDIYSFADFDICPRLKFTDVDNGQALRLSINGSDYINIYMGDTRIFSLPNVVVKPGKNHLIARGGGKLTFELYEEMI